jgi:hypothetical protein
MRYLDIIEAKINNDAESFAKALGMPRIQAWVISQYNKGYKSTKDYEEIVKWVNGNHPNITNYDFSNALKAAKEYTKSLKKKKFDKEKEIEINNEALKFEDGKRWVKIEDIDILVNKLQYDCYDELNSADDCWALFDPQENLICVLYNGQKCGVIGAFGNYPNYPNEIKKLCIRKGIDLIHEAYDDQQLIEALKTGQIDIDSQIDKRAVIKRLTCDDIIDCNLLKYSHYAPIKVVFDLYCKTGHNCLLTYVLCFLIVYGYVRSEAYNKVMALVKNNDEVKKLVSGLKDTASYVSLLDQSVSDITNLD